MRVCLVLLMVALQAQPVFEVASVRKNTSGSDRSPSNILPGGRFTATNNTLRMLILNAFGILPSPYLLEGGPAWIDGERYDVEAKADASTFPPGATGRVLWEQTRLMLRALLADRFKLTIRRETREMPVYELIVAKNGSKLQKSDADCAIAAACHGFSGSPRQLTGRGVDTNDLTIMLGTYAGRPIRDKTGLTGVFDVQMQWNPFAVIPPSLDDAPRLPSAESREGPRPDLASLPTIFTAVEQQLGLKLEPRKGPVEVYVIERVERPTGN